MVTIRFLLFLMDEFGQNSCTSMCVCVCVDVWMCAHVCLYMCIHSVHVSVSVCLYTDASLPVPPSLERISLNALRCWWSLCCGELGTGNRRGATDPFPQKKAKLWSVTMIFVHCRKFGLNVNW